MKQETTEVFRAFVEKAERLKSYHFDQHVKIMKTGSFWITKLEDGSADVEFGLPKNKELDAFLLTFRMFYQQDDKIGILQLKKFLSDSDISDEWKKGYVIIRKFYLKFLHQLTTQIEAGFWGNEVPTNEMVINTVLFGGYLVHVSKLSADRKRYEEWAKDSVRENVLHQKFSFLLLNILEMINQLSDLCKKEIEGLI